MSLFSKLADTRLLKRAWHWARNDSRMDFMPDRCAFSEFGLRLDDYLKALAHSLATDSYHPRPLSTIDVPKSSLSVRPGSVMAIEDRIVLFAIIFLIGPRLDKKLPDAVYSCRIKKSGKKQLFTDHEIARFPFLKRKTITARVEIVEPWYGVWPIFYEQSKRAYESEGYDFLVVSDIVSYFENIDLEILKNTLLHHLPKEQEIINFVTKLLEYWCWPSHHGASVARGIPQGNLVSSFLGNIYLLPFDEEITKLSKRKDLKYLRYMDDVKVFAKDPRTARETLFVMNEMLRSLRLNIQGAKTRIFKGGEIREELFDPLLDKTNQIIKALNNRTRLSDSSKRLYGRQLREVLKQFKKKNKLLSNKQLRLFRRLMTGFNLLDDSVMVPHVLNQLEQNPDSKLIYSAVNYLKFRHRNLKTIAGCLTKLLTAEEPLFDFQKAHFLRALRYVREVPTEAFNEARRLANRKTEHFYVRTQAILLLNLKKVKTKRQFTAMINRFDKEDHHEVRRAWAYVLTQGPGDELHKVVQSLIFSTEAPLQRLGRFIYVLLTRPKAKEQIDSLFNYPSEETLLDRLPELEILSKSEQQGVKEQLLRRIKTIKGEISRPLLLERIESIERELQN